MHHYLTICLVSPCLTARIKDRAVLYICVIVRAGSSPFIIFLWRSIDHSMMLVLCHFYRQTDENALCQMSERFKEFYNWWIQVGMILMGSTNSLVQLFTITLLILMGPPWCAERIQRGICWYKPTSDLSGCLTFLPRFALNRNIMTWNSYGSIG